MYKKIAIGFLAILTLSILITLTTAMKSANELSEQVLRLHILANSDEDFDQALKLKVRDRILLDFADAFQNYQSKEQAMSYIATHTQQITAAAGQVIAEQGYDYSVTVSLVRTYFPTKEYENGIRLPAGNYTAMRIVIGEGAGRNWWCVLFPSVCFTGSVSENDRRQQIEENGEKLDTVLSEESSELAQYPDSKNVKIKFKLIETLEDLFNKPKK